MLSKIIEFLNQPFPDSEDRKEWKYAILIGSFIAIFLYVFKPFNLENAGHESWRICLGFGIITAVVIIFMKLTNRSLGIREDIDSWVLWKWLLSTMITVITIAIANYAFVVVLYGDTSGIDSFLSMLFSTFLLAVFPLMFIGSIRVIKNKIKYEKLSQDLKSTTVSSDKKVLDIIDSEGELVLEISNDQFLFAEAQHNYVILHYVIDQEKFELKLRKVFRQLEYDICDQEIVRCHRSFIVNTSSVASVSGNAQGLRLKLNKTENVVPVSRKYIPTIRQLMA